MVKLTFKRAKEKTLLGDSVYKTNLSNIEQLPTTKHFLLYSSIIHVNWSSYSIVDLLYYRLPYTVLSLHDACLCHTTSVGCVTSSVSWRAHTGFFLWCKWTRMKCEECFKMSFPWWRNCTTVHDTENIASICSGDLMKKKKLLGIGASPWKHSGGFCLCECQLPTKPVRLVGLVWVTQWQRSHRHSVYKSESRHVL